MFRSVCWFLLLVCVARGSQDWNSCSCRPLVECQEDFSPDNSTDVDLTCENEDFVRCCNPVESDTRYGTAVEFQDLENEEETSTEKCNDNVQLKVDLVTSVRQTMLSLMKEIAEQVSPPKRNSEEPEQLRKNEQKPRAAFLREEVPQTIGVKVLDHLPSQITHLPVGFSHPQHIDATRETVHHSLGERLYLRKATEPRNKGDQIDEADIQRLIEENTNFESLKIAPKNRRSENSRWKIVNEQFVEAQYRPRSSRVLNFLRAGQTEETSTDLPVEENSSHEDSYLNAKYRFSRAPGSDLEKVNNFFMQKILSEPLLSLDRASVRATDQNTSNPASKVNPSNEDDDALIRNLYSGYIDNIKRPVRSGLISAPNHRANEEMSSVNHTEMLGDSNERVTRNLTVLRHQKIPRPLMGTLLKPAQLNTRLTNVNEEDEMTTVKPARKFKIPPRVLPVRMKQNNDSNTGVNTHRYKNPKERVLDLFNRSNAKSKNRASIIINRKDLNSKRVDSVQDESFSTEMNYHAASAVYEEPVQ